MAKAVLEDKRRLDNGGSLKRKGDHLRGRREINIRTVFACERGESSVMRKTDRMSDHVVNLPHDPIKAPWFSYYRTII